MEELHRTGQVVGRFRDHHPLRFRGRVNGARLKRVRVWLLKLILPSCWSQSVRNSTQEIVYAIIYILLQVVFPEIHLRTERRKDDGGEVKAYWHDALVNLLKGNGCSRLSCGKLGGGVLGRLLQRRRKSEEKGRHEIVEVGLRLNLLLLQSEDCRCCRVGLYGVIQVLRELSLNVGDVPKKLQGDFGRSRRAMLCIYIEVVYDIEAELAFPEFFQVTVPQIRGESGFRGVAR